MKMNTKLGLFVAAAFLMSRATVEAKAKPKWKQRMESEQSTTTTAKAAPAASETTKAAPAKPAAAAPKAAASKDSNAKFPFYVYSEKGSKTNHFAPSGWMGDYGDLKITDAYRVNPKSGDTCIQISYSAMKKNNAGWAGIYWQEPANNWGNAKGGYDLTGSKKLKFWARGEKGGETIAEFKVGGITEQSQPGDSTSVSIGPITLTKEWAEYSIDLTDKDLSYIIGGFAWSGSSDANPTGFVIYLDDIVFE